MSGIASHIYEFGEFSIETSKRVLLRRGEPLALTPKVFDTLLHLVERSQTVVTKDELMRAIWPDTVVEENNLNQNISAIRRVLGEDRGQARFIATVAGRGYRFVADVHAQSTNSVRRSAIAVLPFKPLVAENRDEALELGMADTLIVRLSGTKETIVRSLSSVRKYSGLEQDALAAGKELGVRSVLDGSIQRRGNRIRVTARLLSVPDGLSLWAQTFDEEFNDVFAVQDTISEKVAAALSLQLSGAEKESLRRRSTDNVEAYHLYLKGWYHLGKATKEALREAIVFFQRAIDIDPLYPLAYAGVAEGYRRLPIIGDVAPKEAFPMAKTAAIKALQLEEGIAEAHMSLGFSKFWFDWDWAGAEKEMKRAIELGPNHGEAHIAYAILLTAVGRHDEAISMGARAVEIDPLSPLIHSLDAWVLYCARRIDDAFARVVKTLEINPKFWVAHLHSGKLHLLNRDYEQAIASFTAARNFSGGNTEPVSLIGYVQALSGERTKARSALSELKSQARTTYVPPHNIAVIHYGLGEKQETFAWLEKAFDDRDVRLTFLKVDPKWDTFRSEPHFKTFLKRMNLG